MYGRSRAAVEQGQVKLREPEGRPVRQAPLCWEQERLFRRTRLAIVSVPEVARGWYSHPAARGWLQECKQAAGLEYCAKVKLQVQPLEYGEVQVLCR